MWLDALTTNVDRTPRNPNLLLWHDRLWLIDHGAALYLQHGGLDPAAHADRPFPLIAEHVLLPRAGSILEARRAAARRGSRRRRALEHAVGARAGRLARWRDGDPPRRTSSTCAGGWPSGSFAEEAERARAGA